MGSVNIRCMTLVSAPTVWPLPGMVIMPLPWANAAPALRAIPTDSAADVRIVRSFIGVLPWLVQVEKAAPSPRLRSSREGAEKSEHEVDADDAGQLVDFMAMI